MKATNMMKNKLVSLDSKHKYLHGSGKWNMNYKINLAENPWNPTVRLMLPGDHTGQLARSSLLKDKAKIAELMVEKQMIEEARQLAEQKQS